VPDGVIPTDEHLKLFKRSRQQQVKDITSAVAQQRKHHKAERASRNDE